MVTTPNRFTGYQRIVKRGLQSAGLGLMLLSATISPLRSQSLTCIPLAPPHLPSDTQLMREFEDLLRDEFEQYLSEVTQYFRCLDEERNRAMQEAAEVATQYSAFLEALRAAPP